MSASKSTFQYKQSISVKRDTFMDKVVLNNELSKKDLRVVLHLLTHLDSITPKEISKKHISDELGMSKKDFSTSLENLEMYGVIDCRSTGSVKNGYILLF